MPCVGFIGAGAMASAIIGGLGNTTLCDRIAVCDPSTAAVERCKSLVIKPKFSACRDIAEVCKHSDVIVLSVKPQIAPAVLPIVKQHANGGKLVVSIMAGLPMSAIRGAVGSGPRIIRVMPNAPLLVGAGATAIAADASATKDDVAFVQGIFQQIGYCAVVPEHLLDAVTGVSGSGPSYLAVAIDALADGGVKKGLPRQLALELAASTMLGTGKLCLQGGPGGKFLHPALARDMVCSPGGTSICGVAAAEAAGLRVALVNAVEASADRAAQLGKAKL